MQDDPEREQDEDEQDEEERKRTYIRRRFVTRGGELVEISAAPIRETR